ncbi:AAA domain-containing protein [Nitrospirillum pindoramense]|uniref:AAA domain-containing protein n=2 Tax=Nitrospirillum amazonense TaxID=28077 RepID=A0A560HCB8_9PROT|nr:AAA domain-containing protein [Nitrospirillum amazonense]
MNQRFGLQQEVLILYSPQNKSDARILTAIEQISRSPDFKHRIDKVLFLLIHNGDQNDTNTLTESDSDRVIINLTPHEILDPHRGSFFLRSKISTRFGKIDLFGMSSPIGNDQYFFGRDTLVQDIIQNCTVKNQSAGLFGLRKTGKTSVLQAILRRLEAQGILCDYIDCQSPGIHAARWWQALQNIVERLNSKLSERHKRSAKLNLDYNQANCGTRFSSDISIILKQNPGTIVLLLDEIEWITPLLSGRLGKHWDEDFIPFWQTIRAAHQELSGRLTFAVAGVNPAAVESPSFQGMPNPIFQLAQPRYLAPFSTEDVRKMLRFFGRYSGVSFDESAINYLTTQFGGHPFLIRLAASEIWRRNYKNDPQMLTKLHKENFSSLISEINDRIHQPIKDILLSLVWWYPEEYQLLQMIASGEAEFVKDYLQYEPQSLVRFANYGLLRPGSSDFAIDNVRHFLRVEGEKYKNEISPFSRSEVSPELLPEVPDLEALGKLFEKRCDLEISLRRAIILYLGIHNKWNEINISKDISRALKRRTDRPEPDALFVGRNAKDVMQDLYTLDLKNIVIENWKVMGALFDGNRQRFEMNMDTINVARRHDGHTKPVKTGEMEDFMNSYEWLMRHLEKVP